MASEKAGKRGGTAWRWGGIVGACLLATGCASLPFLGGGDERTDEEVAEAAPQDDRIDALPVQESLAPDIRYVDRPIPIPPAYANADWTQPGGEPDHTMHHLAAPAALDLAWRTRVGAGGTSRSPLTAPPVVSNGRVFALDNEARVTAFEASTGERVWSTAVTPEREPEERRFYQFGIFGGPTPQAEMGFGGGVALDGGRVFMTTGFGTAAAFDQATGEVLWRTTLDAPVRNPPTAANGRVFAITIANQAVALDQATGEVVWTYESFEETARILSSASPAVDVGTVVVPFSSGEVVALRTDTGRVLWNSTVSRSSRMNALADLSDVAGSPVLDRGAVFAISHAGQMNAIDLRTGQPVWEQPIGGLNTPWVAGDTLFVVTVEGELIALARDDGAVKWTSSLGRYENEEKRKDEITWSGPILAGGRLLLASSRGGLVQVDPQDGDVVGRIEARGGGTVPPVVAGGRVFLIDAEGYLNAFGADTRG